MKILVNVLVPKAEIELNVYIPINKKIGTIKKYLSKLLSEETNGSYNATEQVILLDQDTGLEYNNDVYVHDSEMANGSTIVLI